MLLLAGVDMDTTSPAEWLAQAHAASHFVTGGCCAASPPPPWPCQPGREQQQQLGQRQQGHAGQLLPASRPAADNSGAAAAAATPPRRGRPPAAAVAPPPAPLHAQAARGLWRPSPVAVRRWVLTQKVLVEQRRLPSAHFRYLTMLGER